MCVCMCVRVVRTSVCVYICVRMRVCAPACVLLLHAEPSPLLPAAAWLGRLSVAPPFAAATLLFPLLSLPTDEKVVLTMLEHTSVRNRCC
jgi:hypothetical protein